MLQLRPNATKLIIKKKKRNFRQRLRNFTTHRALLKELIRGYLRSKELEPCIRYVMSDEQRY